jgi:transposase
LTDAQGIPLVAQVTAANVSDTTQLQALVNAIPLVLGRRGRPRWRPERVQGDRGYDAEAHRVWLRQQGITPVLAKRNTPHGSGLGVHRWYVERTIAWLHQFRRLRIRYERRADLHEAFVSLACSLITFRFL